MKRAGTAAVCLCHRRADTRPLPRRAWLGGGWSHHLRTSHPLPCAHTHTHFHIHAHTLTQMHALLVRSLDLWPMLSGKNLTSPRYEILFTPLKGTYAPSKRNETKRNETKRNETKRNGNADFREILYYVFRLLPFSCAQRSFAKGRFRTKGNDMMETSINAVY
jgi:hypothetical protein